MKANKKAVGGIPDFDTAKALAAEGVKVGDTIETEDGQLIEIEDTGELPPEQAAPPVRSGVKVDSYSRINQLELQVKDLNSACEKLFHRLQKIERGVQNVCDNPLLRASQPELINALSPND